MDYVDKKTEDFGDKFAHFLVKFLRFFADLFFGNRYGNRAIVLETVAAVPGMVGAVLLHFKCLRKIKNDEGWIRELLEEADNERMHLMAFMHIIRPNRLERFIVFFAQIFFIILYFLIYVISSKVAHRFVGYLEDEAVQSYTHYLIEIDEGRIKNCPAPDMAKKYWKLHRDATLRDLVIAIREDEARHRDTNHSLSDKLKNGYQMLTDIDLDIIPEIADSADIPIAVISNIPKTH